MFVEDKEITLYVDSSLVQKHEVAMHPCENNCSLKLIFSDFLNVYLPSLGVNYEQSN